MANWRYKINLSKEFNEAKRDEISVQELSRAVVDKLSDLNLGVNANEK